jgi:hypothetical protein
MLKDSRRFCDCCEEEIPKGSKYRRARVDPEQAHILNSAGRKLGTRKLGTDLFFNDGLYVRAYFPAKDHKRLFLEEVEITSPRFKIKHGLDMGTASLLRSSGSSILIEALG